ncbi:MAG: TonB-dependent receptor [Bacteroidia bacterium]|nr:TonB-dependent receptor [Bacteroidia bacterium]
MIRLITTAVVGILIGFPISTLAQNHKLEGFIFDEFGPLSGANVELEELKVFTTTDINGLFSFNLSEGVYTLKISSIGFEEFKRQITLRKDTTISITLRAPIIEIGGEGEPVEVVSREDIANSSRQNLGELLQYLIPTFHSTHQTISDGTDHIDPISLRGLGPDQVLILINGKRFHTSSLVNVNGTIARGAVSTDINVIPLAMVERVEILKNGASTLYGSDAVAGVINIVLKKDVKLTEAGIQTGVTGQGDGVYSRIYGSSGFAVGEKGYVHVGGEYINRDPVNRSGAYTGSVYGDERDNNLGDFFANTGYTDQRVMSIGSAGTRDARIVANVSFPLNDFAEVYGYAGRNYRIGRANGFYRFPQNEARVISQIYPYGFSPSIRTDIVDNYITVGVRGKIDAWTLDFSNTIGANSLDFTIQNSNNASLGLASPTQAYAGGFRSRQNNTNFNAYRGFRPVSGVDTLTLKFGGVFRDEGYEIVHGEDASWVQGTDTTSTGSLRAAGIQVFPGFQPINAIKGDRANVSTYAGVDIDISKNLFLAGTMRYEAFSEFGDNFSWKISARYKYRWLSLRSTFSTGFRAPSLHQVYFNNVSLQFIGETPLRVGTFGNNSAVSRAFGIPSLKPEISENLTFGFVIKPSVDQNLSITGDFYQIDIRDRIVLSGRLNALDGSGGPSSFFTILDPLGVGAAQFFSNAIDTRTRGFDLAITYKGIKLNRGELDLSLNSNFTETQVASEITTPDLLIGKEELFFNREERSRLEVASPANKIIFIANYQIGRLQIRGQLTSFGSVQYIHPSDGSQGSWVLNELSGQIESRDQVFSPKAIGDLEFSYSFPSGKSGEIRLALGAHNILNTYPDQHTHSANISSGRFPYSRRVQQFGVNGFSGYLKCSATL